MKKLFVIGVLLAGSACRTHCTLRVPVPSVTTPDNPRRTAVTDTTAIVKAASVVPPPKEPIPEEIPEPRKEVRPDIDSAIIEINGSLQDAFFDYDRSEPRPEAVAVLRHDADLLRSFFPDFPALKVIVEGHCDERGSAEYNLALGARRAASAADMLREFGVPPARAETISFGKEAPQCTDATEACRQKNRRAHLQVRR